MACSRFHATLRDAQGRLIATPESERILQPVLNQLPGAADALARHTVTRTDGHLRTLLDTSSAVVTSLDPRAVGGTIIGEAQRLVDVQAATALVPDEDGVLRVLVSDGRDEHYQHAVRIRPDGLGSPAALALRDGRAVQLVAGNGSSFPPLSYAEGFQAVLAIPIISRHVGGVVLVMHRTQPQRFTAHGGDLLLTFANYATLAWEHAVLYERSDERLREVARENERLYRQATAEKQTLAAIMRSMNGHVQITAVRHTEGVLVRVADDGPGIQDDELPHIFERLYRATRGHQQRSGGTGLGLAICKAFVEAHEGAIWAESGARYNNLIHRACRPGIRRARRAGGAQRARRLLELSASVGEGSITPRGYPHDGHRRT